jgi:two-component system, NtrC family, nitrogen regulation response regulator GlnG
MLPLEFCENVHTCSAKFRPRVVIVDDEPLIRWALCSGLREAGFDAVAAATATEARTVVHTQPPPDALLLDVRLDDSSARALVGELRQSAPQCRVLVLATAGQDMPDALLDGATMLEKPFDLPSVVRLLETIVANGSGVPWHSDS